MRRSLKAIGCEDALHEILAKSFIVSSDMAHAVHPNYSEKHQAQHKPSLHKESSESACSFHIYFVAHRAAAIYTFFALFMCASASPVLNSYLQPVGFRSGCLASTNNLFYFRGFLNLHPIYEASCSACWCLSSGRCYKGECKPKLCLQCNYDVLDSCNCWRGKYSFARFRCSE